METDGTIFPEIEGETYETWEAGAIQLPVWVRWTGGRQRPWIAACQSLDSDRILVVEPAEVEGRGVSLVREAVARAARKWGVRPARVLVPEAGLARELGNLLEPEGVRVEAREDLPDLRDLLTRVAEDLAPPDGIPGPLSGPGVSAEQMRSLARTAAAFFASGMWRRVSEDDLFRVETPEVEPCLRFFILKGKAEKEPRLVFFEDEEAFDDFCAGDYAGAAGGEGLWVLGLDPRWRVPQADLELWERAGFPLAEGGLLPCIFRRRPLRPYSDFVERPDFRQLDFFEGLLAALAATDEAALDSGRWSRRVETFRGASDFELSLPDFLMAEEAEEQPVRLLGPRVPPSAWRALRRLIRQGQIQSSEEAKAFFAEIEAGAPVPEPSTPEERALDLVDEAHMACGRRRLVLARRALGTWPDCADAYHLLAEDASDDAEAYDLYLQGVAAGERALGPEAFETGAGRFGEIPAARPYLRVRLGVADTLCCLGRLEESLSHYEEVLRLEPKDPLGARHLLVDALLELGRDEEAAAWLDRYPEDVLAHAPYSRVLLAFRREGDSPEARQGLRKALQVNRFVPSYLLHKKRLSQPSPPKLYDAGGEDEAAVYVVNAEDAWKQTPGALEWLEQRTAIPRKPEKKGKEARRRREAPRRPKKKKRRR